MTATADAAVARRLVESWPALSADDLAALCDEHVEYAWVPVGVAGRGLRELGDVMTSSTTRWRSRGVVEHLAARAGVVMIARTVFFDGLDDGRDCFAVPVLGVFDMCGGKVLRWRDYFDRTHHLAIG